ncbi:MAG: radical SAM protein [Vicinamibacterales bacterium]
MTGPAEIVRRVRGRASGRLHSLPILALVVHGACNCRCVMCDIWRANAQAREISDAVLAAHVDAIRRLRVRRVMLTGGEPLLHRNLWALCDRLRAEGIALTLVTTGTLAARDAARIRAAVDTVVVSLDGPPGVHDAIRGVPQGFRRLADGVRALAAGHPRPRLIARSVVQRANHAVLASTVRAAAQAGFDEISFLAADLVSSAFNRPDPWPAARVAEVAVGAGDLPALAAAIDRVEAECADALDARFIAGGTSGLRRIHAYYTAAAGLGPWPAVRCNAPWVSAVLEPDGALRPCFFHPAYAPVDGALDATLNGAGAVDFRQRLDVATDATCRRCVCSLYLPPGADA